MLQPTAGSSSAGSSSAPVVIRPEHWHRPDPVGDVLTVAWRAGAAEPLEIRVRPELYQRLLDELDPDDRAAVETRGLAGGPVAVRLVVATDLPASPGFEVRRAGPGRAAA